MRHRERYERESRCVVRGIRSDRSDNMSHIVKNHAHMRRAKSTMTLEKGGSGEIETNSILSGKTTSTMLVCSFPTSSRCE